MFKMQSSDLYKFSEKVLYPTMSLSQEPFVTSVCLPSNLFSTRNLQETINFSIKDAPSFNALGQVAQPVTHMMINTSNDAVAALNEVYSLARFV